MASAPVIIGDCTEPVRVGFVIDLPPAIFRLTALSSPLVMDGICLGRYLLVSKGVFEGKCLNLSPQLGQPFAPCCLCTGKALTCPLVMHFPCSEPTAVPTAMHSFLNLCTSSPHSHSQSNDLLKVLQGLRRTSRHPGPNPVCASEYPSLLSVTELLNVSSSNINRKSTVLGQGGSGRWGHQNFLKLWHLYNHNEI